MILAGFGLTGTAGLVGSGYCSASPAAQAMPSRMSESSPAHLPRTRTGSTGAFQPTPATPTPLLVAAPITPATSVPCHELGRTLHTGLPAASFCPNTGWVAGLVRSAELIQSPGPVESGSRPSPSLAPC